MTKQQTRLEEEGISKRKELNLKNDFQREQDKNYSEKHDSALTHDDKNHPHGKGTNSGGHGFSIPNRKKSKTSYEPQILSEEGGGSYDIHGINSSTGRNYLKRISLYSKDNQYGPNSIDDSANIEDGQYHI